MSGRKTFTAGEVLQAADVNDYLMDQSVMVFAGTAARGSAIPSPTEGMVTYRSDDDLVEVYNGSSFVPVGTILQVVSTTKTDTFSTTSTSLTDITGLSASITPSSTSNKIFALVNVGQQDFPGQARAAFALSRGGTLVGIGDAASTRTRAFNGVAHVGGLEKSFGLSYLDSPNTTSATTYTLQCAAITSSTIYINRQNGDTDDPSNVRGASSITLMEVAG